MNVPDRFRVKLIEVTIGKDGLFYVRVRARNNEIMLNDSDGLVRFGYARKKAMWLSVSLDCDYGAAFVAPGKDGKRFDLAAFQSDDVKAPIPFYTARAVREARLKFPLKKAKKR